MIISASCFINALEGHTSTSRNVEQAIKSWNYEGFSGVENVVDINMRMVEYISKSFALSSLKVKPTGLERIELSEGSYGVPDVMTCGLQVTKSKLAPTHPLQMSEMKFAENRERMNMAMLRNTQGLHAPLRLTMELQAAKKIGRLPFLPSSGFMSDILTGRDEEIGFEDILNTVEFREQMAQPHAVIEKQLGLL